MVARFIHDLMHAAHNFLKINLINAGMHTDGSGLLNNPDKVCRINEQLGGDAAVVEACTASGTLIHQRNSQALMAGF